MFITYSLNSIPNKYTFSVLAYQCPCDLSHLKRTSFGIEKVLLFLKYFLTHQLPWIPSNALTCRRSYDKVYDVSGSRRQIYQNTESWTPFVFCHLDSASQSTNIKAKQFYQLLLTKSKIEFPDYLGVQRATMSQTCRMLVFVWDPLIDIWQNSVNSYGKMDKEIGY